MGIVRDNATVLIFLPFQATMVLGFFVLF